MAYLLFIPVVYYGTSHVANKIFNMTSDYVLESEELHDDSDALLTAVTSVLKRYKKMKESHPAYKSKLLVEEGMDSLKYMSKTTKERWYQRNYHHENAKLKRLQDELERRLRLFLLVVKD
jgi:hypothetical protein